jgi:23S rRNA (pseudouridine1915-N3)-methyltransferase
MKIQCYAIGKDHEPYVQTGVEDFTRRISKYYPFGWTIIPAPKKAALLSPKELKKKEADTYLDLVQKEDYITALDENGKQLSSAGLAQFIQVRANESTRNLVFLIGGAYGLDQRLLERADFIWSLSALTFPHQLTRLVLAEQIYRACTILRNEKYHHP